MKWWRPSHSDHVLSALGSSHVTGLRTKDGEIACDLVVICGPRVPDAGLLHQAGAKMEWNEERGAFLSLGLPANVSAVGEVTGAWLAPAIPLPPVDLAFHKRAFVCLCNDVSTVDLRDAIQEGFDQIETLKRYTTLTMGPCQGRMCQLSGNRRLRARDGAQHGRDWRDNVASAEPFGVPGRARGTAPSSHPPHAHALCA